jgi:hypothetical protein
MQYESYNYNKFIIYYAKYFFHRFYLYSRFIHQILDLLIKYKLILKIKKLLLIINIF